MEFFLYVLGVKYTIKVKKYEDDEEFKNQNCDGYCNSILKEIVICDMRTFPNCEKCSEKQIFLEEKHALRHELVHAFLNESGLCSNCLDFCGAWSQNEEMVDWFTIQGEKIYKVWLEAEKNVFGGKTWKA